MGVKIIEVCFRDITFLLHENICCGYHILPEKKKPKCYCTLYKKHEKKKKKKKKKRQTLVTQVPP